MRNRAQRETPDPFVERRVAERQCFSVRNDEKNRCSSLRCAAPGARKHRDVRINTDDPRARIVMRKVQTRTGRDLEYASPRGGDDSGTPVTQATSLRTSHHEVVEAWEERIVIDLQV